MPENLFVSQRHPASRRLAVFEDDGTSAWLYLYAVGEDRPEADAWVYNRVPAPEFDQVKKYRPSPPPAARGYAGSDALCMDPERYAWSLRWSRDGHSVAIARDGIPLAFIAAGDQRGHSRLLSHTGPWGQIWSEAAYARAIDA